MNSFSIDQDLSVIIGRILNISKFLYASNIHTSYSGKETTFSVSPKELTFNLCFHDATFYLHFDEKDPTLIKFLFFKSKDYSEEYSETTEDEDALTFSNYFESFKDHLSTFFEIESFEFSNKKEKIINDETQLGCFTYSFEITCKGDKPFFKEIEEETTCYVLRDYIFVNKGIVLNKEQSKILYKAFKATDSEMFFLNKNMAFRGDFKRIVNDLVSEDMIDDYMDLLNIQYKI